MKELLDIWDDFVTWYWDSHLLVILIWAFIFAVLLTLATSGN